MTDSVRDEILDILKQKGALPNLPTLEFYIQAGRLERGQTLDHLDTFAVRDALSGLVDSKLAVWGIGSGIGLVSPDGSRANGARDEFLDGLNDDFAELASDPEAWDDHRREMKEVGL